MLETLVEMCDEDERKRICVEKRMEWERRVGKCEKYE